MGLASFATALFVALARGRPRADPDANMVPPSELSDLLGAVEKQREQMHSQRYDGFTAFPELSGPAALRCGAL